MELKKNWVYHLSVSLSIIGLLYIIVCGAASFGAGQEYPYLIRGIVLLGLFALWMLVWLSCALGAKFRLDKRLSPDKKWVRYGEWVLVLLVLAAAAIVRLLTVKSLPVQPASDYRNCYEIARLLTEGVLQEQGKDYCDYIAMFPHVMGYCYILMLVFKTFGVSVLAGQYLNIFFSVAAVWLVWQTARKLGGRTAGLTALFLCAFWPSQVLYCTVLSAECAFTFFLLVSIRLFVTLTQDYDGYAKNAGTAVALYFLLGALLAVTAAISPMALILLIAIMLTAGAQRMKLPPLLLHEIPLAVRFLERGWARCIMILVPYLILSGVITSNIELTVDRDLPYAGAFSGYSLLEGLNIEAKGGRNEEDAALLYQAMEETGQASLAHAVCRERALARLNGDPLELLNLFAEKYELLWGNDDYGTAWNLTFLKEQRALSEARRGLLETARGVSNAFYLAAVFLAVIALLYLWRGRAHTAFLLALIYLGTAALRLLTESRNHYHYFVLQIFMILAGLAVQFLYDDEKRKNSETLRKEIIRRQEEKAEQCRIRELERNEEEAVRLRKEVFENVFDIGKAIREGHIVMTVTEAYREEPAEAADEKTAAGEEKTSASAGNSGRRKPGSAGRAPDGRGTARKGKGSGGRRRKRQPGRYMRIGLRALIGEVRRNGK